MGAKHASELDQYVGRHTGTLLDLLLDNAAASSGMDDFLAELAVLAGHRFSRPGAEVSCGVTLYRRRKPASTAGSRGRDARSSIREDLVLDAENSGVVNVYSSRPGAFCGEDRAAAREFAADASRAPLIALQIARLSDSRDDLTAAMQSRTIIDMAVGAIMAQNRCQRDIAFKILRNTSNNRNMKIRDVAVAVVAGIAGDTDMSARFDG
ncbi:ANTAR domain-containing protein [Arthrobacter sp. UYCu712]|uniref:ANTAR domain-containing protein n=1 Tax=Arthrobacter sp. UYCu712 TaxID=3156340 RepID=UPI003398E7AF